MRCFNETLNTPITNAYPDIVGVESNSWIVPRSAIRNKVVTDAECSFEINQNAIPVFIPGDLPYKPKSDGTKNPYGLQKFTKSVEFLFVENTVLSQKQIMQLTNDAWVQVFKDLNGQYLVFGLEAGLKFKTSSQDFNSTDTHGGIVVTMEEANVNIPMLFTDLTTYSWVDYEYITGLTIPEDDGKIYVEVDSDKTAYVVCPDGSLLMSVAGVIDTTWGGDSGAVTLIVQRTTTSFSLSTSDFSGNMVFQVLSKNSIDLGGSQFTNPQCDFILDILIANGEVTGTNTIDFTDNIASPTAGKVTIVEGLGWTVPF